MPQLRTHSCSNLSPQEELLGNASLHELSRNKHNAALRGIQVLFLLKSFTLSTGQTKALYFHDGLQFIS